MEKNKGSELNNVRETWDRNEQENKRNEAADSSNAAANKNLDKVIKEEAAEYDEADKEERLLGGERATVRDDTSDEK